MTDHWNFFVFYDGGIALQLTLTAYSTLPYLCSSKGEPNYVLYSQLMEIASTFGSLKAFKFLDKNDVDEPRAFLQV